MKYRVRVESYVCVEARNIEQAKARAELALRKAVAVDYIPDTNNRWAEGSWHLFGFNAKKAERVDDGE